MKKIFLTLGILFGLMISVLGVQATTLSEALSSKKPFIMLIETEWASSSSIYSTMSSLAPSFKNYNFVRVDLGSSDAAALFVDRRFIVSEVPMVVLAKSAGKFNRVVSPSCAANKACLAKELKRFGK